MNHLHLAWAQMRTRLGGVAGAVVVIALGVALAAGILVANQSLRRGFARSIEAMAGRAQLSVRPLADGTVEQGWIEKIEAVPGVAAAVPVLVTTAVVDGVDGETLQVVGVDMLDDGMVRVYRNAPSEAAGIEDPLLFLNEPGSAIAPRAFLTGRGLERGDSLTLRTAGGRREVTVRGVLEEEGLAEAFGGGFLIMDLYALQDHLGLGERASWIDVATADGAEGEVAQRLRELLPGHLAIETARDREEEHARAVAGFEAMVNAVAAMGLLLAAVITSNRLATLYQERLWEVGVLRGIGWSPTGLVRALLGEAALLSGLGVLFGLPLGVLFAEGIVGRLAHTMTLNFQRTISPAPVEAGALPLLLAAIAGMASGILAGWLPARRAAGASIASLKSGRRGRDPRPEPPWLRAARIVVPVTAVLLLTAQAPVGSAALGAIAICLLLGGAALLIRPTLQLISESIGPVSGESGRIGLKDQSRAPGRPIGAAAVLTVGLGLVVWIANTTRSFEIYVSDRMVKHHRSDLVVHSRANQLATMTGTLRVPDEALVELRGVPGVAAVGAETAGMSTAPEIGVIAMDEMRLLRPELRGVHLEPGSERDAFARVARGDAILADRLLREQRGAQVGDRLRITTPGGPLERPVAGVIEDQFQSPKGNIVMSLPLFREHWRNHGVARGYVLADEGVSVEGLRQAIEQRLGDRYGLRVENLRSHAEWVAENVRKASSFLYAMAAITLFVVLIGTADALAASVIERTREIGILRAIGYTPRSMGEMVLAQSFAIGLSGVGLAVALGMGMAIAFVEGVLPSLLGWQLEIHPTHGLVAAVAVSGLIACCGGGLLPAMRAARIPVVSALRHE